jgi:alpha-tubulin suppressor-like RCC1 family protein
VKCWGSNDHGQLGDGTTTDRLNPVAVSGLASGVTAMTAGNSHTCALTAAGGVQCWGSNEHGQLGDGTTKDRVAPVDVSGLASGVTAITAGKFHSCALTTTGAVRCWGDNEYRQLGDGTKTDRLTPVNVIGLAGEITAIDSGGVPGGVHTCALTAAGGVQCWGDNAEGQLGDGTFTERLTPVGVSGLASGVTAIAAGGGHTCVLTSAGGVKCWGNGQSGQLGDGRRLDGITSAYSNSPVSVSGLASGVIAIAAGFMDTVAITTGGGVKFWGMTFSLGGGLRSVAPVDVSGLASGAAAIAAGWGHLCALTATGGVKCLGDNEYGQLGNGTTIDSLIPVDVDFAVHEATATWRAKVGASGANGTATLTATGSAGTLKLALKSLTASSAYPVKIVKGTCTAPGSTLWTAPTQTSTAAGKVTRSLEVPAAKLTAIRAGAAAGPVAIRVGTGSKLRCGPFTGGPTPRARTVTTGAFTVRWSPTNPEEIVSLSWNGSSNLTNSSPYLGPLNPCAGADGGDSEFFGNSWGGDDTNFVSPVGWGTTGQWSAQGSTRVNIVSSASGCNGTSGIPVATSYQFFPQGVTQNEFLVQRKFSFGSTPFDHTFRPYIARLHVSNFTTILYPNAAGSSLVTVADASGCGGGCTVTDWNASWFAMLDPVSGSGMIVRHVPSAHRAVLWIDTDYYSLTTSTAVALVPPAGGFRGTVIDSERLCFFDSSSWTPSLKLPKGCQQPASR